MSVAGGLPRAVERAIVHRCDTFQIFSRNANQWRGRDVAPGEFLEFREKVKAAGLHPVVSHASYLINLATSYAPLRKQSLAAMGEELDRAEGLGLLGVVLHPGFYTSASEETGLDLVAEGLLELLAARRGGKTMIILEHSAGQGTSLGATFEQLAHILATAKHHDRVGVCLDTCHLLASGYDIASPEGYAATFTLFEETVGLDRLKVFHLNDSKGPLGSRADRHEHIGQGCVGLEAFRRIVNDRRFDRLPMLLETPKTHGRSPTLVAIDSLDEQNLNVIRELIGEAGGGTR